MDSRLRCLPGKDNEDYQLMQKDFENGCHPPAPAVCKGRRTVEIDMMAIVEDQTW